eukprot:TRINITY_DN58_c7_g1_i2.p2 TRINITY_DN58_c7_g1~~TRINITY_DN58_c7_g1_i2.p2  ORF type:complete len:339 (-),score=104.99 TRINITY_DN58_c7_g1_i2:784-1800(-)
MKKPGSASVTQSILQATDELLRRVIAWTQDSHGIPLMPPAIVNQIRVVEELCRVGRLPESFLPLRIASGRIMVEYDGYVGREHGKFRPENSSPGPGFWASIKELAVARQAADQQVPERLEPVSTLLQAGVSHAQIGQQIYGRRGVGPFIQPNGDVDVALIEQEAREPGSVIPDDWVPPWHSDAIERRRQQFEQQIAIFEKLQTARHYDDPCTVEEMLQQGAFVQQVQRAKGVSRAKVLAAAQRIGVTPVDRPGYQPGSHSKDNGTTASLPYSDDVEQPDRDALRDLVIDAYQQSHGEKTANEITQELRQSGYEISINAVTGFIGHWKRRQKLEATEAV